MWPLKKRWHLTGCQLEQLLYYTPVFKCVKDDQLFHMFGEIQPKWKIWISQLGSFPQVRVKIKHIWNHQLVSYVWSSPNSWHPNVWGRVSRPPKVPSTNHSWVNSTFITSSKPLCLWGYPVISILSRHCGGMQSYFQLIIGVSKLLLRKVFGPTTIRRRSKIPKDSTW